MLSRALSLATVTLLIGCLTAGVARAVENLEAGKSPSQIFSGTCSACHKSPRGLLKTVPASSLPGFLRQHYTTGTDMASVLASYPDIQRGGRPAISGARISRSKKDAKQDGKDGSARPARSPAAAGGTCAGGFPTGRRRSTTARRGRTFGPRREAAGTAAAAPDAAKPADGQAPVQAATDSKSGAKQKQGKTWQARRRRAAENRAGGPRQCRHGRCVAGSRQG